MSVVGNNRVGIPIVLLHDAEGAVITVETKKGELIRGLLFEAEDMMNLYLQNAVVTDMKGVKRKVKQVYLRGPEIVFIVLPDMLQHAPMFQRKYFEHIDSFYPKIMPLDLEDALRIKHWRKHGGAPPEGVGAAVGQAAAILRKAQERRRGGFGGRGRFGAGGGGGRSGFGRGRGDFGRGGGGFGRGGAPTNTPFGAPGPYGPGR
eukprot:CAMPEP_0178922400 /NCGR_PEP_ID=MMETSP0786-20121207/16131_1 /TAXON_ID=186022 /ORGANISM="Thalassionema frauenfeldii, Strain CCMP 1798" /LENGTH=203 /DNA_ID=CAMNT_0020596757 /DNA_START=16 /DNA_END=629 /DNA_ORIENTATION=-